MSKKREIEYQIKYTKLNGESPGMEEIATARQLAKVSASQGMIYEVAGEFFVISNYRMEPMLFARRCSL